MIVDCYAILSLEDFRSKIEFILAPNQSASQPTPAISIDRQQRRVAFAPRRRHRRRPEQPTKHLGRIQHQYALERHHFRARAEGSAAVFEVS